MHLIQLNKDWNMAINGYTIPAAVPCSDYGAMLTAGKIEDPFYAENEIKALFIAESDKCFSTSFELTKEELAHEYVALRFEMLDTLCDITLNGKQLASTANAYRAYEFDIREYAREGSNELSLLFYSPVEFVKKMQKEDPLPKNANGINGVAHIRKPACHFGWDWGINMPVSAILKAAEVIICDADEIRDFTVKQKLSDGTAYIYVSADTSKNFSGSVICPDGKAADFTLENGKAEIEIKNPELWWTKELSGKDSQPLYTVELCGIKKRIGIRSIELNREKDKYGANFQFVLNGVPIFAKGSNLIPLDALPDRINKAAYEKLIDSVLDANFNMIRVWGGGYYGDDEFYDLCDEKGLLVWQDFMFACLMYPFYNEEFLNNVKEEIAYNVCRISYHPSLALWCGNNEIEFMFSYMPETAKIVKAYKEFFYTILPNELRKYDSSTPYIETSPIGSGFRKDITADSCGDTHMWHVWHGSKSLNYYRKRLTRFCSEYGMESYPSAECVKEFDNEPFSRYSAAMQFHQKCKNGNPKMIYYMLERFNQPDSEEELIYLTGLTQAECVCDAAEHWRRNKGRCNGALWWQLNDCWGAPSWSSIDYTGAWKPLMFTAKETFAPLTVSIEDKPGAVDIYTLNDTLNDENIRIDCKIITLAGECIKSFSKEALSKSGKSEKVITLSVSGIDKRNSSVVVSAYNNGKLLCRKTKILCKDRDLKLENADIEFSVNENEITLCSDKYIRKVFIELNDKNNRLYENCFDLLPGEKRTVKAIQPINGETIKINSLNTNVFTGNRMKQKMFRLKFVLEPENLANMFYYTYS